MAIFAVLFGLIIGFGGLVTVRMATKAFFVVRAEQPATLYGRFDKAMGMFGMAGFILLGGLGMISGILLITGA